MIYTIHQINEALNTLAVDPGKPGWPSVLVLTDAINELEELRVKVSLMRKTLEAWEKWEADWLDEPDCWDAENGLPTLNQDLYDRWCNQPDSLQQLRNKALGRFPEVRP